MSTKTNIEWTDVTDNIIRVKGGGWWCRKISPGCANCYAAKLNQNAFYGGNKMLYSGSAPELILMNDVIDGWARQRNPKKHFVASMTDVFGDWVPYDWIAAFLNGMLAAPKQIFQVLTKRPDVARKQIKQWLNEKGMDCLPGNIWIGTSIEDQERAWDRIPYLIDIPAKVRFLSLEPLLGPVDLELQHGCRGCNHPGNIVMHLNKAGRCSTCDGTSQEPSGIHWLIVGGESGDKARQCNIDWISDIVEQGKSAGVAVFVKQLGSVPVYTAANLKLNPLAISNPKFFVNLRGSTHHPNPIKHPKGGDMAEWPTDLRIQQFPGVPR